MKYCSNCGIQLKEGAKFCVSCGQEINFPTNNIRNVISNDASTSETMNYIEEDIESINSSLQIRNSQGSFAKKSWYVALCGLIVLILTTVEGTPIYQFYALTMLAIFVIVTAMIVGLMFRSRSRKLESLISGENLLAAWDLDKPTRKAYADHLLEREQGKNLIMFSVIAFFIVVIFGGFILFIEDGKMFMFLIGLSILLLIALFAFGMPYYYRRSNIKGNGRILIGAKYAYINGYFHNWDFPLSGLEKVKVIKKPFRGLSFAYYYTDRTLTNTEELIIPAPEDIDLDKLKTELIEKNKKNHRKKK